MTIATLSVRMDGAVKHDFEQFCAAVGMNASVAVNMFVRATLREGRIPFEIRTADPLYSPSSVASLLRAQAQFEAGRGQIHELRGDDE